jgi:hypothetical protein
MTARSSWNQRKTGGDKLQSKQFSPASGKIPSIKTKRTVIDISQHQPELDFEEAEHSPSFTFPEYQRQIVALRLWAGATDVAIVAATYLIFLAVTFFQMPEDFSADQRVMGIYGVGFLLFVAVYFLLFMLSTSQTPGMKTRDLIVVTRENAMLDFRTACLRGLDTSFQCCR